MLKQISKRPDSWLAFELNILRRLEFKSVAIPAMTRPALGEYLKHWGVRVVANSILRSGYTDALARIENNGFALSEEETELVLEDAYVPQFEFKNPGLQKWFGETDAWWFDNVRTSIGSLSSPLSRAVAASIVFKVGDYALSFDEKTRRLRQPLSAAFKRFVGIEPEPLDNEHENSCQQKNLREFTAENYTDLLFLTLPEPRSVNMKQFLGKSAWKEEWISGDDQNVWNEVEDRLRGNLGTHVETKSQYLSLLEDLLRTASHIPKWALAHAEDTFLSTQDIVELIGGIRRVETIYTKDFSELIGTKAVIITA